jgi:hypothetical protein
MKIVVSVQARAGCNPARVRGMPVLRRVKVVAVKAAAVPVVEANVGHVRQ